MSLDVPSTVSVARALTHAVTPKDKWLSERGVDVEWPVAGIPEALHLDNAKEFESAALVRGCQEYGIELEYRPPGRPHFGRPCFLPYPAYGTVALLPPGAERQAPYSALMYDGGRQPIGRIGGCGPVSRRSSNLIGVSARNGK